MAMRINTRELLEILAITPADQNLLLWGRHGIGKSEILTGFYQRRGLRVVPLFLGQMSDPGDLIGLPHKDLARGRTVFLPPEWWPQDGQPVALFLDELNRARPEILQAVHELALHRRLLGRALPAGSAVVAAVNAGDEYQVNDLDPALASRFNVYEFVPEVDEWLAWARGEGLDPRVTAFIAAHGASLDGERGAGPEDPIAKAPDRRAWTRAARLLAPHEALTPLLTKALAGIVGVPAAMAFARFSAARTRLTPQQLLLELGAEAIAELGALSLPERAQLGRQALEWLDEQLAPAAKLPAARRQRLVAGFERYLLHLQGEGHGELLADLISQLERGEPPRASALLLQAPPILKLLSGYIRRVKL